MITGILPTISGSQYEKHTDTADDSLTPGDHSLGRVPQSSCEQISDAPESYGRSSCPSQKNGNNRELPNTNSFSSLPRLAGLVGFFTGCGALIALVIFLPLPAQFSKIKGVTQRNALDSSFYVVGATSIVVACVCYFGLKKLSGEENKGWYLLLGQISSSNENETSHGQQNGKEITQYLPYWRLLHDSLMLGCQDIDIGLGYAGGFVARASSIGISLFIPTYVNAFYYHHGFCNISPNDPSSKLKKECRMAYVLASELTGISQFCALISAPIFGYLSDRYRRFNLPIIIASLFGIIGYIGFALLESPEPTNIDNRGGGPMVFLFVSLIGISQIGAIVCSLGLLGRGIMNNACDSTEQIKNLHQSRNRADTLETLPLISSHVETNTSRAHLKGSIAGIYSLFGSAAILLLTKLGGYLFDNLSTGSPFYMMGIFNGILLAVGTGTSIYQEF